MNSNSNPKQQKNWKYLWNLVWQFSVWQFCVGQLYPRYWRWLSTKKLFFCGFPYAVLNKLFAEYNAQRIRKVWAHNFCAMCNVHGSASKRLCLMLHDGSIKILTQTLLEKDVEIKNIKFGKRVCAYMLKDIIFNSCKT